jgi:hypothetical protein
MWCGGGTLNWGGTMSWAIGTIVGKVIGGDTFVTNHTRVECVETFALVELMWSKPKFVGIFFLCDPPTIKVN